MKTLIAIIALTFVGCATPYQRNQLRVGVAGGFSETKLAPDYYRVTFRGNALTQPERASDFALLHSAEIALENGYAFFEIANTEASSEHHGAGSVGTVGPYVFGSFSASSWPTSGIMIHLLKQNNGKAFDARYVRESIRTKYKIRE